MRSKPFAVLLLFFLSMTTLWMICPFVAESSSINVHLPHQGWDGPSGALPAQSSVPGETEKPPESRFDYFKLTENKLEYDLSMHVLEVDPENPDVQVRPATSHENLFGFSYLSDMDGKWNALASVNGGFSYTDGHLGGLYGVGGELLTAATGQYPGLFMEGKKVFIEDVRTSVWLEGGNKNPETGNSGDGWKQGKADQIKLRSVYYNQFPKGNGLYVFTPFYGSENRVELPNLSAVVSDGEVQGLISKNGSHEIPKDGFLVTAIGEYAKKRLSQAVKPGMALRLRYEVTGESGSLNDYDWAYECGSWILKDGKIVVPDSDTWVGTLKIRTPRTAVGIKKDGTLVFAVADGRQKGLSDGLTGKELAQRLLDLDVRDAAFLDGGASSEMIVNGRIVNSPSAGRERMIASCFVVLER